ncbi:hypothetical protein [Streptomyces lasalocidi]|uniref:DUF1877 family protein n=1 Tax=Streptomyces lasalocidi TaxID=324833 RepID=A0A4U5W3X9_STRLS|nr:hypothetical protein [Streptomyces lasalocidi]TKS96133.1 hypothetical protein E4U91_35790 [Streptomyces lasalocidi]
MAHTVLFFLADDDETAAATRLRVPGAGFESVSCRFIDPDTAIAEWDMHFEEPSAQAPSSERLYAWRPWLKWVAPPMNDGIEVLALPKRLTRALANASRAGLEELAGRWTARLRSEDGDEMTDGDLPAVFQHVARLAQTAVHSRGGLYSWSF